MKAAPGLMVDGKLMNFKEAREWVKAQWILNSDLIKISSAQ
jgi:hypothetical protein